MTGQAISHYRVLDKVGGGGMGVVYRAEDSRLGRAVALKFLGEGAGGDAQAVERFMREARSASALNHPNICTIYEVDEHEGQPFLAMELLEGQTLKQRIAGRPLPLDDFLDFGIQLASALEAAHAKGIIHRDIKPANIFVTGTNQIKVLDFGLAKLAPRPGLAATPATAGDTLTSPGAAVGTLNYMSPEQARGEEIDARSDLFSLGVVFYEMATGREAFSGNTSAVVFEAILNRAPTSATRLNTALPREVETILSRLLEKRREARYQSAAALRTDLQSYKRDSDSGRMAATQSAVKSVAVLYFENLSGAKEDEYFRDGMTEDIITELSKIRDLKVFPRAAVLAFRDQPITGPQVAEQVDATYVLSGSLRRAGNRLRITAQLVDARSGHSAWAERYDRELKDVFEVQDEIARSITQALRITLSPQEETAIARKPTENTQAYDFYLRGRSYTRRVTRTDLEFALQMFERAIELDPRFALAHAGIANVCGPYYEWHERDPRWIQRGTAAADRALVLEANLPEALVARARLCYAQKDFEEAIGHAQKAIELKGDCEGAYFVLGRALMASGRAAEAAALAERAISANGDDYNTYTPYVLAVEKMGQREDTRNLRQAQRRALEQQLETVPEDVRARVLLAANLAWLGDSEQAATHLQIAVMLRPNDANILYNAACVYGILQRTAEALELLKRLNSLGFLNRAYARNDPDLNCLRGNPEFDALLSEA